MKLYVGSRRGEIGMLMIDLDAFKTGGIESMSVSRRSILNAQLAATTLPIELDGREILLDAYAYQRSDESEQVIVLLHRAANVSRSVIPIVRIHSGCVTGDIFHSLRCDCYRQLRTALQIVCEAPFAALVYAPCHEGRNISLFNKLQAYEQQDHGLDTNDVNLPDEAPADARDYALACHALVALSMSKIRLLSNDPLKQQALRKLGVTVVERIPLNIPPNPNNLRYLETKRMPLAHDC